MTDLRAVAAGGTVLDPQVVRAVFDRLAKTAPQAQLTPREREVLGLMARGLSNSAIGVELDITERAVSKYINRIFAKRDLPPGDNVHRRVLAVLHYLDDIET
ncbi:LuxR C-terminal-related transcriptional regulator [Amycolatopsis sp. NPDC051061]|uniref:helix-turn-helix domain-containing protein n=1 Tax=Amycolatopsis sp. NPDC051061 TaxID=3155042 RepID=UPI00343DCB8F